MSERRGWAVEWVRTSDRARGPIDERVLLWLDRATVSWTTDAWLATLFPTCAEAVGHLAALINSSVVYVVGGWVLRAGDEVVLTRQTRLFPAGTECVVVRFVNPSHPTQAGPEGCVVLKEKDGNQHLTLIAECIGDLVVSTHTKLGQLTRAPTAQQVPFDKASRAAQALPQYLCRAGKSYVVAGDLVTRSVYSSSRQAMAKRFPSAEAVREFISQHAACLNLELIRPVRLRHPKP